MESTNFITAYTGEIISTVKGIVQNVVRPRWYQIYPLLFVPLNQSPGAWEIFSNVKVLHQVDNPSLRRLRQQPCHTIPRTIPSLYRFACDLQTN